MAKKINLSGAKEFLFNHGEKVALGTCVFLALLFGALGLLRALSASKADGTDKTWAVALKDRTQAIQTMIAQAPEPVFPKRVQDQMSPEGYVWEPKESHFVMSPYGLIGEDSTNKRMNPSALPIKKGDKYFQLDYVRGLAFVHEHDNSGVKGLGYKDTVEPAETLPPFLHKGLPVRMVVVRAVFPMKKQVADFQKALKMASQKELFDSRDDLPRVLGIDVVRLQMVNGQQVSETLLGLDESGTFVTADGPKGSKAFKALDQLLRDAIYDEDLPEQLKEYVFAGLTTPMPKLANAHYPKITIPGFEIPEDDADPIKPKMMDKQPKKVVPGREVPGGIRDKMKKQPPPMNPDQPMAAGAERQIENIKLTRLRKESPALADRLFKALESNKPEYNLYHALGLPEPPKDQEPNAVVRPGPGMQNPKDANRYFSAWDINFPPEADKGPEMKRPVDLPKGKKGPLPNQGVPTVVFPNWDRDALVQFIDPGVEPGKTYRYAIRVRLANPNFGKNDLVAYGRLAAEKELLSTWEVSPEITTKQEFYFYAVDQNQIDDWSSKAEAKGPQKIDGNFHKDQTTFQIHQWTETAPNPVNNQGEVVIGDWTIAKRISVRRGESIGEQALVLVPIWQKAKEGPSGFPGAFEIPKLVKNYFPKNNTTNKDGSKFEMWQGLTMDMKNGVDFPYLVDFTGGTRLKGATLFIEEETPVDALILSPDGKLRVLNSRVDSAAPERQQRVMDARARITEVRQPTGGTGTGTRPVPGKKGGS